jgi:formylglycine-generating enzyme required for sulfatase activity
MRTTLALAFTVALSAFLASQDPGRPSGTVPTPVANAPQEPTDAKIDPTLLADGQQLAATGVVRQGGLARTNLRVLIEIRPMPGDATFETSRAADPVADVQAAVARRQSWFTDELDRTLAPADRAAVHLRLPLELQYVIAAEVTDLKVLRVVAAVPAVAYVWKDNPGGAATIEGRYLTGSFAQATLGFTGAGVGVAVIDTHFDLLHPELGGSTSLPNAVVRGGYNYGNPGASVHSASGPDTEHGTAVASIVRRYAQGSDIYALVVFAPGSTTYYEAELISAINWCIVNKAGVNGGAPIKAVSMSLGSYQLYSSTQGSSPLATVINTARNNGILCLAAAGNDYSSSSLAMPAASQWCISVGATWDIDGAPSTSCGTTTRVVDERICYSNTAPFLSIYCPSEACVAARCTGNGGGTGFFTGTSAACPAAAGLTAQFLQARPDYAGEVTALRNLYQSTGAPVVGDPGKTRVNLTAALAAVPSNGRRLLLSAPAVLGQTAVFTLAHDSSAINNLYAFYWGNPPLAGAFQVQIPGLSVSGFLRVDPFVAQPVHTGLMGAAWPSFSVAIPNTSSLIGATWDLQSLDLDVPLNDLYFSENDLTMQIPGPLPANLVQIPAGTFLMGSNAASGSPFYSGPWERPVHQVTISRSFWIGKFEVTQAEYQAVMGSNPSWFQGASWPNAANQPVERVSWHDAMAFCAALTAQESASGRLPSGYQYRLPTEAEWEYCCRAGTLTEYHYGNTLLCGQASFFYSYHSAGICLSNSTVVVGSYAPNPWGLFDMHGNVSEWCLDAWDGSTNYPTAAVVDPPGASGLDRVVRGGSWYSVSVNCRSANRGRLNPTNQDNNLGFRVVLAPVLVP